MNKKIAILAVVLYVLSAGVSYLFFSKLVFSNSGVVETPVPEVAVDEEGKTVFDTSLPKTEECPLNGAMYSKQQKKWWDSHRPLGVMIENHTEARPQSGISSADVVYEAVAEGGITRFLVLFYCQDPGIVGPVRSARTYFMDFVSEYGNNPLYAHVGGANTSGPADALSQIEKYGWQQYNDMNQFSIGFPTFYRDYDRLGRTVATEHTMYAKALKLWELADKRGLKDVDEDGKMWDDEFVQYQFKDDADAASRAKVQSISYDFWEGKGDFSVVWTYDPATNSYNRKNGGQVHSDLNTKKQLAAKNIVLLYMKESRANDGYEGNLHMLYGTKGTGKARIFMDGKEITGKWAKKDRTSRTILTDSTGKEIEFTRGLIWFGILATDNDTVVVN